MSEILDRLDTLRGQLDVLAHPFYRRWSAGGLRPGELGVYAGEYRSAVVALADASRLAADAAAQPSRAGLERHAAEERAHVRMWDAFAAAAGADTAREPLPETRACARAWTAGESLLEHLAVLYAVEAGQPQISVTKLAGLVEHYGYSAEGPATEYFRLHATLDVEHARDAGRLIDELLGACPEPAEHSARMLAAAEGALRGNWRLLDGVEARA